MFQPSVTYGPSVKSEQYLCKKMTTNMLIHSILTEDHLSNNYDRLLAHFSNLGNHMSLTGFSQVLTYNNQETLIIYKHLIIYYCL